MNIKALLEYQSLEKELQDYKAAIDKKIDDDLKITEQKESFRNKIAQINIIVKEIESILNMCESYTKDVDVISKKLNDLASDEELSFEDLEYALEDLEYINRQIAQLSFLVESLTKYEKLYDRLIGLKQEHDLAKDESRVDFENYKETEKKRAIVLSRLKVKLLNPREEQLQNIKNQIDDNDFKVFLKIKKSARNYPFICEYIDKRCTGCSLSDASLDKVLRKPGDIAVCPECQRLLFIAET